MTGKGQQKLGQKLADGVKDKVEGLKRQIKM